MRTYIERHVDGLTKVSWHSTDLPGTDGKLVFNLDDHESAAAYDRLMVVLKKYGYSQVST
jgi:hypothetical protein